MITELRYQMKCGEQGVHELPAACRAREKGGRSGDSVRLYNGNSVLEFLGDTTRGGVGLGLFAPPLSNHHDLFRKTLQDKESVWIFSEITRDPSVTSSPVTICQHISIDF